MAITAPTPIAALPAAPDPNDRATFNARAYPWAAAQAAMVTETNAIAENVFNNATEAASLATTASSQVALASAAANYKGLWSSLSGALNMPASVSHNGNYWALNANLANVTTATPGVSGSWQALNVGAGGATETSSAVDVTLTAASYRVQAVAMTAADKSVTLPNATTLSTGAELFVIKNTGTYAFCLRDGAGVLLVKISPSQCAAVHLVNAGTSAGVWALTGEGFADSIYQAIALNVTATASALLSVTPLSATTAIAAWYGAGGFISTCVLTISGTTVSAGTVLVTAVATANTLRYRLVAMSSTQALLVYAALTTSYLSTMTLNVSGTTVTAGAALQINSLVASYTDVVKMSATQAVVVFNGTSNYGEARTLNISGTTVTAGATCVVYTIAIQGAVAAEVSGTQLVVAYSFAGLTCSTSLLTVSGTTITVTSGPILTNVNQLAAVGMSATQVLFYGTNAANSPRYCLIDVTGSVLSVKDILDGYGEELTSSFQSMITLSYGRAMVFRAPRGGSTSYGKAAVQIVRVADSRIVVSGQPETLKGSKVTSYTSGGIGLLSTGKVIAAHLESNDYVQARVLEVSL